MEKRSHRHVRDLVAHAALRGLDANEIGCARISMMARSNTLHSKGRIQMSETNDLQISHVRLAAIAARPRYSITSSGGRAQSSVADQPTTISLIWICGEMSV